MTERMKGHAVVLTIRRIRYAMVLAVILIVGWFMWQARGALIPFLVGGTHEVEVFQRDAIG